MNKVILDACSKIYDDGTRALDRLDLTVAEGEFLTLLGSSGSGKSTILNLVTGVITPTTGRIFIDDQDVTLQPVEKRSLGMVFQSYALMPHLSVAENIAFPLKVRRIPHGEIAKRVREVLEIIDLGYAAERLPSQLSGGQQQRVSLARAIVYEPAIILMDEPLGALDRNLREQMQVEIKRLHRDTGITILYVTHDQEEALALSDRIAVLSHGRIKQIGTATDIYMRPQSEFVARFLGESNIVTTAVSDGRLFIVPSKGGGGQPVPVPGTVTPGTPVGRILLRPESLHLAGENAGGDFCIAGCIIDRFVMGSTIKYRIDAGLDEPIVVRSLNVRGVVLPPIGEAVRVGWREIDMVEIPDTGRSADTGARE